MTLRTKLFSITATVVLVLVVLCVVASRHFLLKHAIRLERQQVAGAIDRVNRVFDAELSNLGRLVTDWAAWDDTYAFIENGSPAYVESNLPDLVMRDLGIHLVFMVNPAGRIIYGRMVDDTYTNSLPSGGFAAAWLKPGSPLLCPLTPLNATRGFLVFQGTPILAVSKPILTSRNEGPARGWVIMARRLGPRTVGELGTQAGTAFSLLPIGALSRFPLDGGMIARLLDGSGPEVHDASPDTIYGFRCLRDMSGAPTLLLSVAHPRDLFQQEQVNVRYIALWFLFVGIALLAFTLWLLERYVLIPLRDAVQQIREGVADVAAARSLARRLHTPGEELGDLAIAINQMLDALEAAQREANANRDQLIRVDKLVALGTLVSGIAHEINNPNTVIGSNALVLLDLFGSIRPVLDSWNESHPGFRLGRRPYPEVGREIPELLKELQQASQRIAEMIRELKQFSSPSDVVFSYPVSLNDAVRSATTLLRAQIPKSTRRFDLRLDESLPPLRANPARLEQVVVNLLHNALLAVKDPEQGVSVSTGTGNGALRLVVQDEGCGIPPEQIARLTDPFFTTRREQGGTGLGLYVVANIVKEHGGTLAFQSEPGRGTTVTVTLPIEKGDAS